MSKEIINISLPSRLKEEIDSSVKSGGFSNRSDFLRYLIEENKLLKDLLKSKEEIISGKGKKLNSLKDLR